MGKIARLLNEQPELFLAKAQIATICMNIVSELNFDFDDLVPLDAFIDQILFCYLKDRRTSELHRTSITKFGEPDFIENGKTYGTSETEIVKRTRKQVIERKRAEYSLYGIFDTSYLEQLETLSARKEGQFTGYGYNSLDYLAIKNCARNTGLHIISYLMDGKITSSKKVSGDQIRLAYTEYKNYLEDQSKAVESNEWLRNLFDVASIEGGLHISLIYHMACYMEDMGIDTLPDWVAYLGCLFHYPYNISVQSRFLALRNSLIPFVCESPEDKIQKYFVFRFLPLHANALYAIKQNEGVHKAIDSIPAKQLVKEFQEKYNLFNFAHTLSNSSGRFASRSFVSKLREAVRILFPPEKYQ